MSARARFIMVFAGLFGLLFVTGVALQVLGDHVPLGLAVLTGVVGSAIAGALLALVWAGMEWAAKGKRK